MNNSTRILKLFAVITAIAIVFQCANAHAFVSPKRVMIDDRESTRAITIFNSNNQPMVYTFAWQSRAQLPNGTRKTLKEGEEVEGYRPAHDYLLYSPRKVVIMPGKFQTVRLLARRPSDLEKGEYHSHLLIMPEPLEDQKRKEEKKDPDATEAVQKGIGGEIRIRTFMSIPVFLRHGKTTIDFDIDEISVGKDETGRDEVSFVVNNKSTRSFYSRNEVACTKADGSKEIINIGSSHIYSEGRRIETSGVPNRTETKLEQCAGLTLRIGAHSDFEHKAEPIKTAEIR